MSLNSKWFLDTQHSFSFKAEHEIIKDRFIPLDYSYSTLLIMSLLA